MVKVTICGAAGGIGQPLSLLFKLNPLITELSLFDIVNAEGVAADLQHICTPAIVTGHLPTDKLDKSAISKALKNSNLVVIPAGVPRKPGMTRDDLFKINASIVRDLVASVAKICPNASILIILNPVNSTVPIAAEVLKKLGVFNPKKLFGVTTLDTVRAETFLGELISRDPRTLKGKISVIGGHSGDTIVPLVHVDSTIAELVSRLTAAKLEEFTHRVQFGGDEVVQAKKGAGSATLSMAYAGYRFGELVVRSLAGEDTFQTVPDSAFVYLPGLPNGRSVVSKNLNNVDFFSVPVILQNGQIKSYVNPFEDLNITSFEQDLVKTALKGLEKSVDQGVQFVKGTKL